MLSRGVIIGLRSNSRVPRDPRKKRRKVCQAETDGAILSHTDPTCALLAGMTTEGQNAVLVAADSHQGDDESTDPGAA